MLLASCATVDPLEDPQLLPKVGGAAGVKPADIALVSRISWASTDLDYCWTGRRYCTGEQIYVYEREALARRNTLLVEPKNGLLVLTASELILLDVDGKSGAYLKNDSILIENITALELEKFGMSRRMRLNTLRSTKRFYFMTSMGPLGQQQDLPKNEQLFDHLKRRLGTSAKVRVF